MTLAILIACGALLALCIAVNLKTSRSDGTLVRDLHPYRRIMPYIMQGRNESMVYFDDCVRAERLLEYVARARQRFPLDVSHCLVGAAARALAVTPALNRFVSGRRLYQRNQRVISFSMKRKALDRAAKLAVVKLAVPPGQTFAELCQRIDREIEVERSGAKTYTDRELSLFTRMPRPLLDLGVRLLRWLDFHNLLPAGFIRGDGMYASLFVANLGSLGMGAAYHHLYEWGNCPVFLMVGKVEERALVEEGKLVIGKVLPLRYSYDERIEDGLNARHGMEAVRAALEDPFTWLGCVAEDGSDARPLDAPPPAAA
jgi:hypothetical protein